MNEFNNERELEYYARKKARRMGFKLFKMEHETGIPDRLFIGKGVVKFIEFKSPTGKLRFAQVAYLRWLRENRIDCGVFSDRSEVDNFFKMVDNNTYIC